MNTPITARAIVAEAREAERKGANMGSIRKILIVDDSATERHMLNDLLTKAGFDVVSSDNGEDAIVKARQVKPDLILMDVVMPGLNGLELAQRVMAERPHLRVLFMSGYADHAVVQRDIVDAGRPFLQKPFAPDRLLARVKEVLA